MLPAEPVFRGLEVVKMSKGVSRQLPAILITGYPSETLKRDATAAKIRPVLAKPFELAELKGAIEEAMTCGADSQPS